MRSYSVFLPPYRDEPSSDARNLADVENMVLVKEGFFWLAALVPLLWLLANRMWLVLLGYIGLSLGLALFTGALGFSEMQQVVVALTLHLLMGFEGQNLKCWTLKRKGWRAAGLAVGENYRAAERDFLSIYEPPIAHNDLAYMQAQVSA